MILAALFACAKIDDTAGQVIGTDALDALIEARSAGDGTTAITARLLAYIDNSPEVVELGDDERMEVHVDGETFGMQAGSRTMGGLVYSATIDVDAPGTEIEVAVYRAGGDAPSSRLTLPEAGVITVPDVPPSRAADFTLTWTPSGSADEIDVFVQDGGDGCLFNSYYAPDVTTDTGTVVIPAGALQADGECAVGGNLERTHDGELDAAFATGTVHAVQARVTQFGTVP